MATWLTRQNQKNQYSNGAIMYVDHDQVTSLGRQNDNIAKRNSKC